MAVNLINSNDIEVEQAGSDIQLKTSTPLSTITGGISDNTTNITALMNGEKYSSTQETLTSKTLDGKPVYRSYIEYSHASTGNFTYSHNLGIDTLVSATIMLSVANQTIASHGYRPNPYISGTNNFMVSQITENTMISQATGWNNNKVYAWLEYTKVS